MVERLDEATLLAQLNALLTTLALPFTLASPLELTPSLILALFESLLRTRLPIPRETRRSATHAARVAAMKSVLGVLADDVLGKDVGLDAVDPRRLAEGKKREVCYVGEVLCWLARRMGYLTEEGRPAARLSTGRRGNEEDEAILTVLGGLETTSPERREKRTTRRSFSPLSVAESTGHGSSLLMLSSQRSADDSQTTITAPDTSAAVDEPDEGDGGEVSYHHTPSFSFASDDAGAGPSTSRVDPLEEVDDFPSPRTRRLLRANRNFGWDDAGAVSDEDDEFDVDVDENDGDDEGEDLSICHCPELSIRESGYLEEKSFDDELEAYRSARGNDSDSPRRQRQRYSNHPDVNARTPLRDLSRAVGVNGIITKHTSPSQYTLALLEERARLLNDLAKHNLNWNHG